MADVMLPTGADVAAFLGRGDEPELVSLAGVHVGIVTELAKAYTRGRGFRADAPLVSSEIKSVVVMATARTVVNPEQHKREQIGEYTVTPGSLYGWSLVEIQTLNRYRKRNGGGFVEVPESIRIVVDGGEI